ncbi:hypothetical protein [Dyadobacter aurulentus]|uniref:hypothetical protein n=1 Tax=Dyadobacter sp. UC 10 TaxID=2605428 RepID=UPI0011F1A050|nr:hypothetical protein [Dyadobacter sp. UC 10]KAA0993191.1 hypothetical protein FXO21_24945 [Dyadobacter sp. UC 10]
MKKTFLFVTLCFIAAVVCFFSCEKSDGNVSKQVFLQDAPNLATQNQGFYSKVGKVDVINAPGGDQKQLIIKLHDSSINPYEIRLYFAGGTDAPVLKSGKYEVLFLRSALIINDPVSGKKTEFVVRNDIFNEMKAKLPENYLSSNAVESVGIAVYGNHDNKKGGADLVPTCATSGGPGAVSCSNTCCSVSCTTGYYASCKSDCICIKSSSN